MWKKGHEIGMVNEQPVGIHGDSTMLGLSSKLWVDMENVIHPKFFNFSLTISDFLGVNFTSC